MFSSAKAAGSRTVVLMTQADMFASGTRTSEYGRAYRSIVRALASESRNFRRPVFLFNGDTHTYLKDRPLTSSKWLTFYGISGSAPNLTRVTIEGEAGVDEWIKAKVVSGSEVLQIRRVMYK